MEYFSYLCKLCKKNGKTTMAQIKTEKEYEAAMKRIDELLPLTWGDNVPEDSPENIELSLLSDLVAEYEDVHYPIAVPSLSLARTMCLKLNITPEMALGM